MKNLHFSARPTGRFVSVVADSEPAAGALSDGCRGGTRFFLTRPYPYLDVSENLGKTNSSGVQTAIFPVKLTVVGLKSPFSDTSIS